MLTKTCNHCGKTYQLSNVRVDEHWNRWSTDPAYCYCPHCDARLDRVTPDIVDLAKHIKPRYITGFVGLFLIWFMGMVTNTLTLLGPVTILVYGAWLARSAKLRDHRVIGHLLIAIAVGTFFLVMHYI